MKTIALIALMLAPVTAQAAPTTLGIVLAAPELAGIHASLWQTHELSWDMRATLATVDGGVTGHIPLGGAWDGGLHTLAITGLAGYAHNAVAPIHWLPRRGLRLAALVGYGYINGVDVRIQAGVAADPGYGIGLGAQLLVGWIL